MIHACEAMDQAPHYKVIIMKIERINDNQFRCTMSMGELLQRHISIKMLRTDSQDARRLVREMIERSADEVGFEPNDFPVMVEAVRNPEGDFVFTVTKINSPEELPPQFQPQMDFLRTLQGIAQMIKSHQDQERIRQPLPLAVFSFPLSEDITLSPRLKEVPKGIKSSLYRSKEQGQYFLVISATAKHLEAFQRVFMLMIEYGRQIPSTTASQAYYAEHAETVYASHALEKLIEKGAART